MRQHSGWNVVAWLLGALMLGSALFSIGDHVLLLKEVMSRGPHAGPMQEWPF